MVAVATTVPPFAHMPVKASSDVEVLAASVLQDLGSDLDALRSAYRMRHDVCGAVAARTDVDHVVVKVFGYADVQLQPVRFITRLGVSTAFGVTDDERALDLATAANECALGRAKTREDRTTYASEVAPVGCDTTVYVDPARFGFASAVRATIAYGTPSAPTTSYGVTAFDGKHLRLPALFDRPDAHDVLVAAELASGLSRDAAFVPAQPVGIRIDTDGAAYLVCVPEHCTYSARHHVEVPVRVACPVLVSQAAEALRRMMDSRAQQMTWLDVATSATPGTFVPLTPALTARQVMSFAAQLPSYFDSRPAEERAAIAAFFAEIHRLAPETFACSQDVYRYVPSMDFFDALWRVHDVRMFTTTVTDDGSSGGSDASAGAGVDFDMDLDVIFGQPMLSPLIWP